MKQFRNLQTVYWQSRPGAPVHCGTIVEIVRAGVMPELMNGEGMARNEVSYVVRVQRAKTARFYWPRTRWLALDELEARTIERYKPWIAPGGRKRKVL